MSAPVGPYTPIVRAGDWLIVSGPIGVADRALFEFLVLEGAQAGLSWRTVLSKRERYREVFAGFDIEAVAGFGATDVERLLGDAGIIRNRAKVDSAIGNARAALTLPDGLG